MRVRYAGYCGDRVFSRERSEPVQLTGERRRTFYEAMPRIKVAMMLNASKISATIANQYWRP